MFAKLSEQLTEQLEEEQTISSDDRELYKYGFQNGMILLLNLLTAFLIGWIFGMFWENILLLASYIPLRSYAGGHHSSTSGMCYMISSLITILWVCLLRFNVLSASCSVLLLIVGTIVCIAIAPIEDINKPFDENEKCVYRKRTLIVLAIEVFVSIVLFILGSALQTVIPLAVFTESIMLVLGKVKNCQHEQEYAKENL